jgi:FkbM family methyltransferase
MRLLNSVPKPCKRFLRRSISAFVYRYGFHPYHFHTASSVEEQTISFKVDGRMFTVKADHLTPLYDMIYEVVDYDAYQLSQINWEPSREHCILDIGANVGVSALYFSQLPGANVTCYEPHPDNCAFLRRNLELNQIANVRVIEAAVDSFTGSTEFDVSDNSSGGHIMWGPTPTARRIKVNTIAFDEVIGECNSQEIDLVKLDCEGSEYAIIDQLNHGLAARIRNITLEVHDLDRAHNLRSISAKLAGLGYELTSKASSCAYFAFNTLLARRTAGL